MDKNTHFLRLAHLYPDTLNLYGDYGNILAFSHRLALRNCKLQVKSIHQGEPLNPDDFDLFFMGGGQDSDQATLMADLFAKKQQPLAKAIEQGKVFLGICGGYQLLGKGFLTHDGQWLRGMGLIDFETIGASDRLIQDTVYTLDLQADQKNGTMFPPLTDDLLFGFENHSGRTYLGKGVRPLAAVIYGHGNNGKDQTEGVRHLNVFGTYAHGSFLPKNPKMTDTLLGLAFQARGIDAEEIEKILHPVEDVWADRCREIEYERLKKQFYKDKR